MKTISPSSSIAPPQTAGFTQRTPWHSPVPYLFGGLAAMLGLIAFALLILACSYWKLSVQSEERERHQRDLESGDNDQNNLDKIKEQPTKIYEEKILVIMAGDHNPTFLATPVTPKISSFSSHSNFSSANVHSAEKAEVVDANFEKVKEMVHHHENDQADE